MERVFYITTVPTVNDPNIEMVKFEELWGGQLWNCGHVQMFKGSGSLLAALLELGLIKVNEEKIKCVEDQCQEVSKRE